MNQHYQLTITFNVSAAVLERIDRLLDMLPPVDRDRLDKLSGELATEEAALKSAVSGNPLPPA